MRRVIIVIVILLAVAFVLFSLAELQSISNALQKSNLIYLMVGCLIEVICLINTSVLFGTLYRLVGLTDSRKHMFLMSTAANFINMIAPGGGVGGLAVFLDEAHRHNTSKGRVMAVGLLYLIYEYGSLLVILAIGLAVLNKMGVLNIAEILASVFVLILAIIISFILSLGYKSSQRLGNFLANWSRLVNFLLRPILHRDVLSLESAHDFSRDIASGISSLREDKKNLAKPLLYALNNKALLICILACSFLAFQTPFTLGTLVGGFSVSHMFVYASPTPNGVGFVDGILPSTLKSLQVPLAEAVLITLTFRAITLWLPFATGAAAFRILQSRSSA